MGEGSKRYTGLTGAVMRSGETCGVMEVEVGLWDWDRDRTQSSTGTSGEGLGVAEVHKPARKQRGHTRIDSS